MLPTRAKVGAYIDAGRLAHVDIHKDRSHLAKKEGVLLNFRAGTKTSLSCRDSDGPHSREVLLLIPFPSGRRWYGDVDTVAVGQECIARYLAIN